MKEAPRGRGLARQPGIAPQTAGAMRRKTMLGHVPAGWRAYAHGPGGDG